MTARLGITVVAGRGDSLQNCADRIADNALVRAYSSDAALQKGLALDHPEHNHTTEGVSGA